MARVNIDTALAQYRYGLQQLKAWHEGRVLRRVRRNLEALKADDELRSNEATEIVSWAKDHADWIRAQGKKIGGEE